MRQLVDRYLKSDLSRRGFVERMVGLGFTAAAAQAVLTPLEASESAAAIGHDMPGVGKVSGTGGETVIAQMKAAGVKYLFTNPGSFEVGFFDAFSDQTDMQLIMGLHEGIVISMADGYHRVTQQPSFVNVHVIAGTAQAAGQMYNASRDGSSIVVTAGLNDNELWSDEAGLAPRPGFDQKEVNRQFTKISWESRDGRSLALMVRRALKVAVTEPGGPVYLAMAQHALEAKGIEANILPAERFLFRGKVRPSTAAIEKAAKLLIEARNPVVVVGDEVWKSGAQAEMVAFAEKLGLPVTYNRQGFQNFPMRHPLFAGRFRPSSELQKPGVDLILLIGSFDFGGYNVPSAPEAPYGARFVRIGVDTSHMGRNYPTDVAVVGDVNESLRDLSSAIDGMVTKQRLKAMAEPRSEKVRAFTKAQRKRAETAARKNFGKSVIHADELGAVMARTIDRDAIVVSENLTAKRDFFNYGYREDEQMWIDNTGHSLGWGIGAATGAKLAAPDRQVVCTIGDGSVMYSASGFWTQRRYSVPVLTVISNNHNYQTVRGAYYRYQSKMAASGHYTGMYLGDPDIDFVKLAESQGVAGEQVTSSSQLESALKRGIKATRDGNPYVVEVVIGRYGGGAESTWHQKFSLADTRKRKV